MIAIPGTITTSHTLSNVSTNTQTGSENDIISFIWIAQMILYSLIVIVGVLGNSLVCRAVLSQARKRTNDFFILNLAITDLGTCGISVPLDMVEQIWKKFPFGEFMCRLIYPLQTIFMATSVLTLLSMSIERYRAIVTPLQPKLRGNMAKAMLIGAWALSVSLVAPYISVLEYKDQNCSENWPADGTYVKVFTFAVFMIVYFIPLSIITFCYARVLRRLYKDKSRVLLLMGGVNKMNYGKVAKQRAEQNLRTVKILVTAVVAFGVCLLPNHVVWLWHDFSDGGRKSYFGIILIFCNILIYTNSIINPFIFGKLKLKSCCGVRQGKQWFSLRSGSYDTSSSWMRTRERSLSSGQLTLINSARRMSIKRRRQMLVQAAEQSCL